MAGQTKCHRTGYRRDYEMEKNENATAMNKI